MSQQRSIIDQIQALSNERQRLYRQKWSFRNRRGYREEIKSLNEQIDSLWQLRRKELAGPPPLKNTHEDRIYAPRIEVIEPLYDESPVIDFADILREIGAEVVQEVLAELREDDEVRRAIPLRAVLARRNQTLEWTDIGRGRFASRVVALNVPIHAPT